MDTLTRYAHDMEPENKLKNKHESSLTKRDCTHFQILILTILCLKSYYAAGSVLLSTPHNMFELVE